MSPRRVGVLGCGVAILAARWELLAVSTGALTNRPSPQNPRSSAVVPWAVVRSPRKLCGTTWRFT